MATLTTDATLAQYDPETGYITNIEELKAQEYPTLSGTTYLDYAGTTAYPKSLIDRFSIELTRNLFGNPHSASASSQLSTRRIEDVRLRVLRFFNANIDYYDVVFTANATAAIKLVGDIFRDVHGGFRYAYHVESHTSLVGVRELAENGSSCFSTDEELSKHLAGPNTRWPLLVALPGQSNMTGKKLSLPSAAMIEGNDSSNYKPFYTLYDAAALASTSPVDLSSPNFSPDFMAVSFYKIFGFPDLGALILRKDCAHLLDQRKFFGGGTVESVVACGELWHAKKAGSLHSRLEDGTLPFHNIIALGLAFDVHAQIFGSMAEVCHHVQHIAEVCLSRLRSLRHVNGRAVCEVYGKPDVDSLKESGPVIAFNLRDPQGNFISNTEFEKLSIVKNIQLRTGGLCNPGGTALHLGMSARQIKDNHSSGYRCGGENDTVSGKPLGAIRVSFGATSSLKDVAVFLDFIDEFFVEKGSVTNPTVVKNSTAKTNFIVESLSVFPIKSCAAFKIPPDTDWEVGPRGLAWDREWCLVHEGTWAALSQKRYPSMALLRPSIDLSRDLLRIEHNIHGSGVKQLTLNLTASERASIVVGSCETTRGRSSQVCGESVEIDHYTSTEVSRFFTEALGVPCTLARFPHNTIRQGQVRQLPNGLHGDESSLGRSISLSNESPVLLISRSSVNKLNEEIKARGGIGKTVSADSFRGNIVISEQLQGGQLEVPFIEDEWTELSVGEGRFEVLGPCQRCQMVCVDQRNACRRQEPFSTLSKIRRRNGRVWFGMHLCLVQDRKRGHVTKYIRVGDSIMACSSKRE